MKWIHVLGIGVTLMGALTSCSVTEAPAKTTAAAPAGMDGGYFVLSFANAHFVDIFTETEEISRKGPVEDPTRTEIIRVYNDNGEQASVAKYERTGETTARIHTFELNGLHTPESAARVRAHAQSVAAKADILTAEQISARLSPNILDGTPTYDLTFTSATTAKARSESLSGTTHYIIENIDVTFVPANKPPAPTTAAIPAAPATLDGVWIKLEHYGSPSHTWLYGHQGKLYRLNHPDAPATAAPPKPTRFTRREISHWYEDNQGRIFALAEQFAYSATSNGFLLSSSFPTLRGPFNLGATVADSYGDITVNCNSPIQVTTDQSTGNIISGSCKGYYGREGLEPNAVTRITLYK